MHSLKQMDKELPDVLQALVIFVMAGCTHLGVFSARTRHKSPTTSMNNGFTITSNLNTLPVKKMSRFYRLCLRWPYLFFNFFCPSKLSCICFHQQNLYKALHKDKSHLSMYTDHS